jgi:hypothetical protein
VGGAASPTLVQAVSLVSFTMHVQSSVQSIITVSSIAVESVKVRIEFSSPGVHPSAPSKPPPDHEMLPTPRPQCLARNLSKLSFTPLLLPRHPITQQPVQSGVRRTSQLECGNQIGYKFVGKSKNRSIVAGHSGPLK